MNKVPARIVFTLLLLLLLVGMSFAATHPLNVPLGLVVDKTGKLYVANYGGNDILVYNLTYGQVGSKRITANISSPIGVAFDPSGNMRVANTGSNSITEYSPNGAAYPAGTITNGVNSPEFLAVDGLGDIWVNNGTLSVNVYAQTGHLAKTITPFAGNHMYGIAVDQGWTVIGTDAGSAAVETLPLLLTGPAGVLYSGNSVSAAFDSSGNCYRVDFDGRVHVTNPGTGTSAAVFVLPFAPFGIAVDSVHQRLYFSNPTANQIAVYDLSGNLLHTIQ